MASTRKPSGALILAAVTQTIPPISPQWSRPDDAERQARLDAMKRRATALLAVALVVFVVASIYEPQFAWLGYVRATAEASLVGGLADWFAVTALFRHPLGLPIPHTALIPSRKDAIGRSLGNFVRDQFLDSALLVQRLRTENRAIVLARWLDSEAAVAFISQRVVDIVPLVLRSANDRDVRRFIA